MSFVLNEQFVFRFHVVICVFVTIEKGLILLRVQDGLNLQKVVDLFVTFNAPAVYLIGYNSYIILLEVYTPILIYEPGNS